MALLGWADVDAECDGGRRKKEHAHDCTQAHIALSLVQPGRSMQSPDVLRHQSSTHWVTAEADQYYTNSLLSGTALRRLVEDGASDAGGRSVLITATALPIQPVDELSVCGSAGRLAT